MPNAPAIMNCTTQSTKTYGSLHITQSREASLPKRLQILTINFDRSSNFQSTSAADLSVTVCNLGSAVPPHP